MVKRIIFAISLMCGCLIAMAQQSLNLHTKTQGVVTFSFEETPKVTFSGETLIVNAETTTVEFPFEEIEKITFTDGVTGIESIRVNEKNAMVTIHDISGRLVRKYKPQEESVSVDLSPLPSGIYVVNDGKRTYKVMKR